MAHTIKDKQKLINRVRRIRDQIEAIEKALAREEYMFGFMKQRAPKGVSGGAAG
jgi:DNA-binding FrmR family transcriptional regulator